MSPPTTDHRTFAARCPCFVAICMLMCVFVCFCAFICVHISVCWMMCFLGDAWAAIHSKSSMAVWYQKSFSISEIPAARVDAYRRRASVFCAANRFFAVLLTAIGIQKTYSKCAWCSALQQIMYSQDALESYIKLSRHLSNAPKCCTA